MKHLLSLIAVAFALFITGATMADEPEINLKKPSFLGGSYQYALNGYDSTSYWTADGPKKGKKNISLEYKGATWLFRSEENRDKFKAAPEKYAPQYGNYCAYALGNGYLAAGDPKVWDIVDGKLYLNYNKSVQKDWRTQQADFIKTASGHWPTILKK